MKVRKKLGEKSGIFMIFLTDKAERPDLGGPDEKVSENVEGLLHLH